MQVPEERLILSTVSDDHSPKDLRQAYSSILESPTAISPTAAATPEMVGPTVTSMRLREQPGLTLLVGKAISRARWWREDHSDLSSAPPPLPPTRLNPVLPGSCFFSALNPPRKCPDALHAGYSSFRARTFTTAATAAFLASPRPVALLDQDRPKNVRPPLSSFANLYHTDKGLQWYFNYFPTRLGGRRTSGEAPMNPGAPQGLSPWVLSLQLGQLFPFQYNRL